MPKPASFIEIITCDYLRCKWPFKLARQVPEFCEKIDDYEEQQEQQDSDDEYPPPESKVPISSHDLEQVQAYLKDKQAFLSNLRRCDYEELTALWHASDYLDLTDLRDSLLSSIRRQEQKQQEKNFYIRLNEALEAIVNSTPKYFFDNIQPQTKGSYEDRKEAIDELKQQQYMAECDNSRAKFDRARFDNLIRLALCRIIYIIENHGATAGIKNDFGLRIAEVFECLVCALLEAEHKGRSGDDGVDGLSSQVMIQCKAGTSHRNSAKRIWREMLGTCLIHKRSIGILAVTDGTWEEPPEEYQKQSNESLIGSALGSVRLELYSQRKIIKQLTYHRNPCDLCTRFLNNLALNDDKMCSVRDRLIKTFEQWNDIDKNINKFEERVEDICNTIGTTENFIDSDISTFEIAWYEGFNRESSFQEEEEDSDDED